MPKFLKLALWNANGLTQHPEELKTFISIHNIDVKLISENHFTDKSYLKLPNYAVYHTNHPAGTARGGTVIIIKNTVNHHQLSNYSQDYLQATSESVEDLVGLLTISAVYLPPKHTVKQEQLEDFYVNLGRRFIAGGVWGSRLITPRGREVLKTMERNNLKRLSTGKPTYCDLTGTNYLI
jgi:exonuclease III